MTVVLVHGNPETEALWAPLVDQLGRDDLVRLSPPGFGAPLPRLRGDLPGLPRLARGRAGGFGRTG
jgi:pimeloyl-ACP methyl ester carboxylesterase